jgi:hypothetical protein
VKRAPARPLPAPSLFAIARAALAAVAALAGGEAPAVAAPPGDAYGAALTRAIAAKEQALDRGEPARWEEVVRLFQEADAIRPARESKYEIGFAAERAARADLATEAYEAALDLGLVGPARAKAQAFVAAHAAALGRLVLRGPPEVRIRIAGVDRGGLPLARPLVLFPGTIQIDLTFPDGRQSIETVRLRAGQVESLEVAGTAPAAAAAATPAAAGATPSPPPAAISLDTGPELLAPAPDGKLPDGTALAAGAGAAEGDRAPAPRASRSGWWLVGAGAAAVATGAILIASAGDRISEARRDLAAACDVPDGPDGCMNAKPDRQLEAQDHADRIATWKAVRTGSWIGVGVGALAAGLGAWFLLTDSGGMGAAAGGHTGATATGGRWHLPAATTMGSSGLLLTLERSY